MSQTSEPRVFATLVRGGSYTYLGVTYLKGEPRQVTQDIRRHLERYAVDLITIPGRDDDDETEFRVMQKFDFREEEAP